MPRAAITAASYAAVRARSALAWGLVLFLAGQFAIRLALQWRPGLVDPEFGLKLDYLKAVVRLASERDDLGPPLRAWLREFTAGLPADSASPS